MPGSMMSISYLVGHKNAHGQRKRIPAVRGCCAGVYTDMLLSLRKIAQKVVERYEKSKPSVIRSKIE